MTGNKNHEVASARRRLIRGTFAAPAVLALHSGSVLAGTSTSCLANGRYQAQPVPVVSTEDTTYVRVRLHTKGNSQGTKWYINGADVYSRAFMSVGAKVGVDSRFFSSAALWREVIFPSTTAAGPVRIGSPISAPGGTIEGPRWIALRFAPGASDRVDIVGVVDGTETGSALSNNCWCSISGTAP